MKNKKIICLFLAMIFSVSCLATGAMAADTSETTEITVARATGRFNFDVAPGNLARSTTSFPLEAGETVTINMVYSPSNADVRFGLINSDGEFRYLSGENGNCEAVITVSERGYYTFAVRNNSSVTVAVSGFIYY